jgi:hypothetical protein
MPICQRCNKTTFDGAKWKSTINHPEFIEKYLPQLYNGVVRLYT